MKINSVTWIFDVLDLRKSCSVFVDKLLNPPKEKKLRHFRFSNESEICPFQKKKKNIEAASVQFIVLFSSKLTLYQE